MKNGISRTEQFAMWSHSEDVKCGKSSGTWETLDYEEKCEYMDEAKYYIKRNPCVWPARIMNKFVTQT